MAKKDARKNGFEKTNPEDLAAKEEKFRTFFSTSVAQVPDEMKNRDDEKQEPAKQKTQSSILGRILGRAKEEAEPASEKPAMPQELPPTGEIRLGGEDEAAEPKAELELAERTKMQVVRVKSENGKRMAIVRPSCFLSEAGDAAPTTMGGQALLAEYGLN